MKNIFSLKSLACLMILSVSSLCKAEDPDLMPRARTPAQEIATIMKLIELELEPLDADLADNAPPNFKIPTLDSQLTKKQAEDMAKLVMGPGYCGIGSYRVMDVTGDGKNDLVFSVDANGRHFYESIFVITKIKDHYYKTQIAGNNLEDISSAIRDLDHDGVYEFVMNFNKPASPANCSAETWNIYKWNSKRPGFDLVNAEYRTFFEKKIKELESKLTDNYIKSYTEQAQCDLGTLKGLKQNLLIWSGKRIKAVDVTELADPKIAKFMSPYDFNEVYYQHFINKKKDSNK